MGKIVVLLLVTFTTWLTAAQANQTLNQPAQAVGGRYLIQNKIINTTNQFRQKFLKNGTLLKEKITILEIIDIETNVPDNENYVTSFLVYNVFKNYRQMLGLQTDRIKTHRGMLSKLNLFYNKWINSKVFSPTFRSVLKKYSTLTTGLLKKQGEIPQWAMKSYFHSLLRDIASAPHLVSRTFDMDYVNGVIQGILGKFKVHNTRNDYLHYLHIIMNNYLFKHEKNQTLLRSIPPNVKRAVEMCNIDKKKDVKSNLFHILIRSLSQIGYRLEYWTNITRDRDSHIEEWRLINGYLFNNLTVFHQEVIQEPRKFILPNHDKYRHMNESEKHEYIERTIIEILERAKTKSKLRHVYPKNLVDLLNTNKDHSIIESRVIEAYKNYKEGKSTESFDIKKVKCLRNKSLVRRFENNLLDKLLHDKNQVKLNTHQKQGIRKLLDSKDFKTINVFTIEHIKQLLEELGFIWPKSSNEDCCDHKNLCLKETKRISNILHSVASLQKFNKYKNGELHKLKFATNMIHHRANTAVNLYKAYDEAHDINDLSERDLPKAISDKISSYQTILKYLAFINRFRKRKPTARLQREKLLFNANPLKPNTIISRQSESDAGYLVSIAFPNILVESVIKTYVTVDDVKANLVKESESLAPYINKEDPLPGKVQFYETKISLEYITKEFKNVKILMRNYSHKPHTGCYKIVPLIKENIHVHGQIVPIGHPGLNCTTDKWEVLYAHVGDFDVDAAPYADLSTCVS